MKRLILTVLLVILLPSLVSAKEFRVGLMPAKESLPFYAEEKLGIFKKYGITLVIIPFRSALERDSAFEAGKIDGAINDIIGTALISRGGKKAKILRTIARSKKNVPVFRIMKAKDPGSSKDVAISSNTVIEYVTDRIIEKNRSAAGLKKTDIKSVPLRMQLLLEGKVGWATIAEPLASYLELKGAGTAYTDEGVKGSQVLFMARTDLDEPFRKQLLAAFDEISLEINKRKGELKDLLWAKLGLPAELRQYYAVPDVGVKDLPARDEVEDVLTWMRTKNLLKEDLSYEGLVLK